MNLKNHSSMIFLSVTLFLEKVATEKFFKVFPVPVQPVTVLLQVFYNFPDIA